MPHKIESIAYLYLDGLAMRYSIIYIMLRYIALHCYTIPFIIHQHIIHRIGIFILCMTSTVYRNKLTEFHIYQLYGVLQIFLILILSRVLLISPHLITCFVDHS